MNGVHDMGGQHGAGPIDPARNGASHTEPWEMRVFALAQALDTGMEVNIDSGRHFLERMPPDVYLRARYYERWLYAYESLARKADFANRPRKHGPALRAGGVEHALARGTSARRPRIDPPRFEIGNRVRARTHSPKGHTRLPRYARGRAGTVLAHHGTFVFPDSNAHGQGEAPAPLYAVRFTGQELWGADANPTTAVVVDLWEPYLEPA